MSLYVGAKSQVNIAGGPSEEFEINVGLHQGSALSPLLFILVMEEATKYCKTGGVWELLYADDLVITGESKEEVMELFEKWKKGLEKSGIKVNTRKTKITVSEKKSKKTRPMGRFPCGVCSRGVGVNSILCSQCEKWCHKRCSGLSRAVDFACPTCSKNQQVQNKDENEDDVNNNNISDDQVIDEVNEFCYLGDFLSCDGGSERAVKARVALAWRKWKEISSLLCNQHIPLRVRASIYISCIRGVMLYEAESWNLNQRLLFQLRSSDRRMLRYMCGISKMDNICSNEVESRCGICSLEDVVTEKRLRWFGHVKRRNGEGALGSALYFKVAGMRPRGRPKKTWWRNVKEDPTKLGLTEKDAQDRKRWHRLIKRPTLSHGGKSLTLKGD